MWNEDKDTKQMHIILFIRMVVTAQQKILSSSYKSRICVQNAQLIQCKNTEKINAK